MRGWRRKGWQGEIGIGKRSDRRAAFLLSAPLSLSSVSSLSTAPSFFVSSLPL